MFSDEESIGDSTYLQLSNRRQMKLIDRYCGGIEEMIRRASSYDEARLVAEQACVAFQKECPSDIISRTLALRVLKLVEAHWKGEGADTPISGH